ncbi:MAG: hypothetical protein QXV60_03375, partial [Nitrososphaerota archaeon]
HVADPLVFLSYSNSKIFMEGVLSNHRFVDYTGFILPELVLVSVPNTFAMSGLPVINSQGRVIGMQTTDVSTLRFLNTIRGQSTTSIEAVTLISGPSEFFMKRVIKTLIKALCKKDCSKVEKIEDPAGTYFRYKKPYLGIAYDLLSGVMYDFTSSFRSDTLGSLPRIKVSQDGKLLSGPAYKEIVGIRVLGVAGVNPNGQANVESGHWFVPGGNSQQTSPLPSSLPVSPVFNTLTPGDVITHINGFALGAIGEQVAPSVILWRLSPGDQVEITYRRGGRLPNGVDSTLDPNYNELYKTCVTLGELPKFLDYPWYSINRVPRLTSYGFLLPLNQRSIVQFPQVTLLVGGVNVLQSVFRPPV